MLFINHKPGRLHHECITEREEGRVPRHRWRRAGRTDGSKEALEKAGAETELVSIKEGSIDGFHHLDKGDTFKVDKLVGDVDFNDYDALVLPGGVANPDELRQDRAAVAFARSFVEAGKPVAAICHAPWLLVEANVVRGRTLTSFPSVKTDIVNAGGHWVDERSATTRP